MKKPRTIVLSAAALMTAGAASLVDGRADSADSYYTLSAPHIIVVPRSGDEARRAQASLRPAAPVKVKTENDDHDDDAVTPSPRHLIKPPLRTPHVEAPVKKPITNTHEVRTPPRRRPFSVSLPEPPPRPPEPMGPRRALLSAPPPPPVSSLHDGPTPLKPTPRFGEPLPEQPAPLTKLTPPSVPIAVASPQPDLPSEAPASAVSNDDDHLPPPGNPATAPPEPAN